MTDAECHDVAYDSPENILRRAAKTPNVKSVLVVQMCEDENGGTSTVVGASELSDLEWSYLAVLVLKRAQNPNEWGRDE